LLPFLFIYDPGLILMGSPLEVAVAGLKGLLAVILLSAGFNGYLRTELKGLGRLVALVGGGLIFSPIWWLNLVGVTLALWVWVINSRAVTPSNKLRLSRI
jgi:TRAP-type uncharacterized transport system fused permease subunit